MSDKKLEPAHLLALDMWADGALTECAEIERFIQSDRRSVLEWVAEQFERSAVTFGEYGYQKDSESFVRALKEKLP